MKDYLRISLVLFCICLFAGLGLSLINKVTRPRILAQLEREEKNALEEVIPGAEAFDPIKKEDETYYYRALDKEKTLLGYTFKAKRRGYSSDILTMVGMKPDGKIISIKILEHNETPGIGSKVNEIMTKETLWERLQKSLPMYRNRETQKLEVGQGFSLARLEIKEETPWFYSGFKGKDAKNLDKEVDAISGATISSKAVINSIKEKAEGILREIQNER